MATLLSHFKSDPQRDNGVKGLVNENITNDKGTRAIVPWVEKYRPKKVEEVVFQEEVVSVLKRCVQGADLPNLLFYGPPGTGKTSAAVALCHQMFKTPRMYKDRVLEMNASDERGIDIVRNRIKDFARVSITSAAKSKDALVPLKVVILDEADAMTGAAQSALRRTMEDETYSTRFFLICNYITRIIEPLTSRCAKFRFKPLIMEAQKERLLMISSLEGVNIDGDAIDELVSISGGDLRKSITLLQSLACSGQQINIEDVRETAGQIPDFEMDSIIAAAKSLDHSKVRNYVKEMVKKGYNANQFLSQFSNVLLANNSLQPMQKVKLFEKIAESERKLLEGANEYLQLLDLSLTLQGCLAETN